jgi:hypothetical protein
MIYVDFFQFVVIFFKTINESVTEYSFQKNFSQNAIPI